MYSLTCNFPLIGEMKIDVNDNNLFVFAKRQLKNYLVDESVNNNKSKYIVNIKCKKLSKYKFDDTILGREIQFIDNKLNFIKSSRVQKLKYYYDFPNSSININLTKKLLFFVKSLLSSSYSINHSLFYETILYPIFSLYTMVDNYSLVHGSLLKVDNKHIVLAGLDGVGKSSLSNELVKMEHNLLSDNFVLFNGSKFIGLNMPIRLDLENDTKENIIFKDDNLKEVLYKDIENDPVDVDKIFFLSISKELAIKKMNNNIVNQNWNLINNGASEILGANVFNIPFLYINAIDEHVEDNILNSYIFSIPKGKIKEATKELICQLNI
jgi:tRNA uridine 5-carbamoylmethylation protein Kti12